VNYIFWFIFHLVEKINTFFKECHSCFRRNNKHISGFLLPASAGTSSAGMTSIFLDFCYLLPAFAGTGFAGTSSAGMTKRSGNVSLIICLLYYFANFWEMILFFYFEKTSMSPRAASLFFYVLKFCDFSSVFEKSGIFLSQNSHIFLKIRKRKREICDFDAGLVCPC